MGCVISGRMEAVVKISLFGLIQSLIVVAGLAACFYANNFVLVGIAAGLAVVWRVVGPLSGTGKQKKLEGLRDQQRVKTLAVIDGGADVQLEGVIPPPFPHRATVAAFLELANLGDPGEQLQRYDDLIEGIREADEDCAFQAAAFSTELTGNVLGVAMEGLAALALGNLDKAQRFFEEATQLNRSWVMPWLGWATVCYQQGDYETLAMQHPHINEVELLSYDCGDEQVFLRLSESDRESLLGLYQQTVTALGNYYAAAEIAKSRQSHQQTHEELHRAA